MVSVVILGMLGLFVAIGLAMTGAGGARLRKWWTMRRMDPSGPMTVEEGLQEFEGVAQSVDGTVRGPFSGTGSLVCTHKVQRYDPGEGSNWDTIDSETRSVPFEVESSGSRIAVDGDGAQHLLTEDFEVNLRETDDPPERVRAYMEQQHGIDDLNSSVEIGPMELDQHNYRFVEERLDDGEEVYVLGTVRRDPSRVPDGSGARMAINPQDYGLTDRLVGDPFVISDTGEEEAIQRQFKSGISLVLFGLVFTAFPVVAIVLIVSG